VGKYPETQDGLERAILEGFAMVNVKLGGEYTLISGQEGVQHWT
jgi:hypothetical protein